MGNTPPSEFPQDESHFVLITIWESIMPIDRGDRYEDPLEEALGERGCVVGGGSQMSKLGGIEFVDIELQLQSLTDLDLVVSTLESAGAPVGSEIKYQQGGQENVRIFGKTECLAILLDGVGLPDEVYENSDIDELADKIMELLDGAGAIRASFSGATRTAVLIYGEDAGEMWNRLESFLRSTALFQNADVVFRFGKPDCQGETITLPMH